MGTNLVVVILAILALGVLGFEAYRLAAGYLNYRGARVVACPETGQPAAVVLAAWRVAGTGLFGHPRWQVRDCSRWRERAPCAQPCLVRIAAAPEDCLVWRILAKWGQGKSCMCCGRPLELGRWGRHGPCLMSPDLRICAWNEFRPEHIPQQEMCNSLPLGFVEDGREP